MSAVSAPNLLCKSPNEIRYFEMDFTNWLGSSETISTIVSTTSQKRGGDSSDLTITEATITGSSKKVQMKITGGTDGRRYSVFVKVTTSAGNTLEAEGYLKVIR